MKKTKSQQKYPNALKRKVAEEYLAGKFSYAIAAEEYGLANKLVAKEFVRWYRRNYDIDAMLQQNKSSLPVNPEPEHGTSTDPASAVDVAQLQKELAAAKLKITGLEALIDEAEKELHIDIRKKSGAKQSR